MLAVNLEEEPQAVLAFRQHFSIPFPVLLDQDGQVQKRLGARGHPSTVFIDRKGRIVGRILGERDWSSEAARQLVRSLLESKE